MSIVSRLEEAGARTVGNHDQGALSARRHGRCLGQRVALRLGFITCLVIDASCCSEATRAVQLPHACQRAFDTIDGRCTR